MRTELRITGTAELRNTLLRLPEAVSRRVQLDALKDGALLIQGAAQSLAPRRTGELATHIVINTVKKSESDFDEATVAVGPAVSTFYGSFQELADEYGGVHHAAQPFMRPAFEQRWRSVLNLLPDTIWRAIARWVGRARLG